MHELSICQSLRRQLEAIAAQHHAHSISSIHLQLGPLCGVDANLLEQAFPMAMENSIASNAKLTVDKTSLRVECQQCHSQSDASPAHLCCENCGSSQTTLISGDEMLLTDVELVT